MKISRKVNGLYRSTKVTMVVCAILLIITATALFMLMLFPIQPKEPETIVLNRHSPVQLQREVQETEEETLPEETEPIVPVVEAPHTLSTWSANINGFKQNFAEFNEKELGITTADPFPLRTKATTTTTTTAETEAPPIVEDVPEVTVSPQTEISVINETEVRATEQTVTQAVPTEEELAPPPMPDVAE